IRGEVPIGPRICRKIPGESATFTAARVGTTRLTYRPPAPTALKVVSTISSAGSEGYKRRAGPSIGFETYVGQDSRRPPGRRPIRYERSSSQHSWRMISGHIDP